MWCKECGADVEQAELVRCVEGLCEFKQSEEVAVIPIGPRDEPGAMVIHGSVPLEPREAPSKAWATLAAERDALKARAENVEATIAGINAQNEELRNANQGLFDALKDAQSRLKEQNDSGPVIPPNSMFTQATLLVDGAGKGWWIHPEAGKIWKAW